MSKNHRFFHNLVISLLLSACQERPASAEPVPVHKADSLNAFSNTAARIDFCAENQIRESIWGLYLNKGDKNARSYAMLRVDKRILKVLAGREYEGTWSIDKRSNLVLVRIQNCEPAGEPSYLQEFRFNETLGYLTFRENAGGGDRRFHGLLLKARNSNLLLTVESEGITGMNTAIQIWKHSGQADLIDVTDKYFENVSLKEFMTKKLAKSGGEAFSNQQFPPYTGVFVKIAPENLRISVMMDSYPGHFPKEVQIQFQEIQRGLRERNFIWSLDKQRFVLEK